MLLEKRILSVHVSAIEQAIPVANVLPIVILIIMKAVSLVLDQVLVTLNIHFLFFYLFHCLNC